MPENPDVTNGLWLEGEDGLYILPLDGDEIIGPDDATADTLMQMWQEHDNPHDIPVEECMVFLGLARVPDNLKRWDPQDGYYHA